MRLGDAGGREIGKRAMSAATSWQKYASLGGYVTQWSSLHSLGVRALEQALGFNSGALAVGYAVYGLADRVGPDDFDWRDRTRYSGGWHADPTIKWGSEDVVWSVQRIDELRAALGKRLNYDEARVDQNIAEMKHRWINEMSVCFGERRIVKVISNQRISEYPNSPLRGIRQWEFRRDIRKRFEFMFANE